MWDLKEPNPVKLIIGILGADRQCLEAAMEATAAEFGSTDLISDIWPFTQTDYYKEQTGENILRQFVSIEKLIDAGILAKIKHKTNKLEQKLAKKLALDLSRPVNLDPGPGVPYHILILITSSNAISISSIK
jgi:hypothetical protein